VSISRGSPKQALVSANFTAGRCHRCSTKTRKVVYVWKAGEGRRLYDAHCPRCGFQLSQTTLANMKDPVIKREDPVFHEVKIDVDFDSMEVTWR